jgi:hypothetical protein
VFLRPEHDLVATLHGCDTPAEMKARLVVNYGIHPDSAEQLIQQPDANAAKVASMIADLVEYLSHH